MRFAPRPLAPTVLALLLGFASVSCGATRAYEGEARPAGETALLVGMSPFDPFNLGTTTKVVSVDGKPVEGGTKLELLPGTYTLELYASTSVGSGTRTVEVELEAGMRYLLAMSTDPETLVVVVGHGKR
jgi:hypothetical protein